MDHSISTIANMKSTPIPPSTTITRYNSAKSVIFSPKVKVIFSFALDDFTDEEIEKVWITPEEDNTSKQHIVQTLSILRSNGGSVPIDLQSDFTALGLENMVSQMLLRRNQQNKERHLDGVLDVQDDSSACAETVARIAMAISQRSKKKAVVTANRLAADLKN